MKIITKPANATYLKLVRYEDIVDNLIIQPYGHKQVWSNGRLLCVCDKLPAFVEKAKSKVSTVRTLAEIAIRKQLERPAVLAPVVTWDENTDLSMVELHAVTERNDVFDGITNASQLALLFKLYPLKNHTYYVTYGYEKTYRLLVEHKESFELVATCLIEKVI